MIANHHVTPANHMAAAPLSERTSAWLRSGWLCPFAAAVAAACYLNAPACAFAFDDHLAVLRNPDVTARRWQAIFLHDFWGRELTDAASHKSYRPLTILTFWLEARWTGGPPTASMSHAVNAILHCVNAGAVAEVGARTWQGSARGRRRVSLLAGLLFAAHPVHTEAVTGVVGRAELLCALFAFATHAIYTAGLCATRSRGRVRDLVALALCFTAAVLSKETGLTVLGVLAAHELLIVWPEEGGAGRRASALRLALLASLGGAYVALRVWLMSPPSGPFSWRAISLGDSQLVRRAENPLAFVSEPTSWLLSFLYLQVVYVSLLVFPYSFCIEYSYDCIPMIDGLYDRRNLYSLALLLAAGVACVSLGRSIRTRRTRCTLTAVAWLIFPWLPTSHLVLRLGTLVAERTMYLPSVGAVLLLAHGAPRVLKLAPRLAGARVARAGPRGGAMLTGLVVGYLSVLTLQRNLDWRSDETAFEAALHVCPRSAKLHQQMCTLRTQQGRLDDAERHCHTSRAIDPLFCDVDKSMAFLRLARDDILGAVHHLNASLGCVYTNVQAYRALLVVYDALHRENSTNASLYSMMASTHAYIGNYKYAALLYREAAALHVRRNAHHEALDSLAAARMTLDASDEAEGGLGSQRSDLRLASKEEASCVIEYWRGKALVGLGRYAEARDAFQQAQSCEANPSISLAARGESGQLEGGAIFDICPSAI